MNFIAAIGYVVIGFFLLALYISLWTVDEWRQGVVILHIVLGVVVVLVVVALYAYRNSPASRVASAKGTAAKYHKELSERIQVGEEVETTLDQLRSLRPELEQALADYGQKNRDREQLKRILEDVEEAEELIVSAEVLARHGDVTRMDRYKAIAQTGSIPEDPFRDPLVDSKDDPIEVAVVASERYRSRRRGSAPNFRVRVTLTNTGRPSAELDVTNFAITDDEGHAHFIGVWDRLPDDLLKDDLLTLQGGEFREGWLYFEVGDPSRLLHLEYSPTDLDADVVSIPLGTGAQSR